MFEGRNKFILLFLGTWCVLFAALGAFVLERNVSSLLETEARAALEEEPLLAGLQPKFRGLTGWFEGTLNEPEHYETAVSLASQAIPAGRFLPQSSSDFVSPAPEELKGPEGVLVAEEVDPPSPSLPTTADQVATLFSPPEPVLVSESDSPTSTGSRIGGLAAPPRASEPEPVLEGTDPTDTSANLSKQEIGSPQQDTPAKPLVYDPAEWGEAPAESPSPEVQEVVEAPTGSDQLPPSHPTTTASSQDSIMVDEWAGTVFFAPDSSVLKETQLSVLELIVDDASFRTDHHLRIVSYTDPRGDLEYNEWLGLRRAERVQRELARLGLDLEVQIALEPEAGNSPSLSNPEIDRRVELRFIK